MIHRLLDTCICVEIIRGRSRSVLSRLRSFPPGSVGISSITLAELEFGVARSSNPARNQLALAQFCAPLSLLPFDNNAASAYGAVRHGLEQSGTPVGPLDTLIAAHALSLGVPLVTANEREFRLVKGLRVENWTRA